ncbi:hypothetical protein EDB89DRAFT_2011384 [Lactarius sanguifluus]|nr:hypothetical protein EDB89DRAFT_2011384 [Lactarius sanguifluus]
MLHFRRVRGRSSKCHIQALLIVPLHHLRLRISALPTASGDAPATSLSQTWPAPFFPSSRAYQHTSSRAPAHGSPSKRTHSCPLLNSPAFLLPDMALPTVGAPESSNPALIRLGARRGFPSLPASRSASALLPNSRSTVRSSCSGAWPVLRNLLALALALRSMRALVLLAAAPGTLTHLALPHFVGVPPCSA